MEAALGRGQGVEAVLGRSEGRGDKGTRRRGEFRGARGRGLVRRKVRIGESGVW